MSAERRSAAGDPHVPDTASQVPEIQEILAYQEATKHSPESVRRSRWAMDWSNKPYPFKRYAGLPRIGLEREAPTSGRPALEAIARVEAESPVTAVGLGEITRLLTWGAGLHHAVHHPDGQTFFFRTYASAGALYPVEVYVVCGELDGLGAGVYHYLPHGDQLVRLREGDHRPSLVRASAEDPAVVHSPVVLALTGIPWRTAWKYAERGYRHLFWDAGMIVANLLALAASVDVPARVVVGFADREVELLFGLDGRREVPLCLLSVGTSEREVVPAAGPPEEIELPTLPLSRTEYAFEAITAANEAGRLGSPEEVERWRDRTGASDRAVAPERAANADAAAVTDGVEDVIRRRGSARGFGSVAMPREVLVDVLGRATRRARSDHAPDGSRLIEPYLIINRVDGLKPGAYVWRDDEPRLLREGDFRNQAAFLCLDQRLGGESSTTVFLMADLPATFGELGARGYRAAQLEAGTVAGKVYLASYAHRLGATGLTFFDDEVERFFSPDAVGKSCMLVVAVGDSPRLHRGG